MATLNGRAPKASYQELLKMSNTGAGVDTTLRTVEDGTGQATPLSISTTQVAVAGRLQADATSYKVVALGSISGAKTIDLSTASEFTATITGATTFTFTNSVGANLSQVVFFRLTNPGTGGITWPTGTMFTAATAPTYTSSGVDLFGVKFDPTTSTYMVFVIGQAIA